MKYRKILMSSYFKIFSCLLLTQLNWIINISSYLFYLFGQLPNYYLKIILFNFCAWLHLFLHQFINLNFYSSSYGFYWINQFIPGLLLKQFTNHTPEFPFIIWLIVIFTLTTFLNKNQLFMRFYISIPSFFLWP